MKRLIHIYVLLNREGSPIYVGKSVDPEKRLSVHKTVFGSSIRFSILETVPREGNWREAETRWIAEYRRQGFQLNNISPGGTGPSSISDSTKEKLSRVLKNSPAARLQRAKMFVSKKGKPRPQWVREKISATLKSNSSFQAHLEKLHEAKKGVPRPLSVRTKISATLSGRTI